MYETGSHRSPRRSTNLASCMVAAVFLLFLVAAGVTVFFLLFKPKEPRIAVDAVRFPTFSVSNGTVNFTFFQKVSVTNPNRQDFTHYDSSLQLVYSGTQVGFVFIPAGQIGGGRTQHMSAKFDVEKYPLTTAVSGGGGEGEVGPTMEIETRMELVGRVRVLEVFTHKVRSRVGCRVAIGVNDGTLLGFHCSLLFICLHSVRCWDSF